MHYHPLDEGGGTEFIELLNTTDATIDLSGWTLSGVSDFFEDRAWRFPSGTTIDAGDFALVVPIDPEEFRARHDVDELVQRGHLLLLENPRASGGSGPGFGCRWLHTSTHWRRCPPHDWPRRELQRAPHVARNDRVRPPVGVCQPVRSMGRRGSFLEVATG